MNIRRINLNLLLALDALLTEQHVSRAAQKIFITQPAMSNALNQLREIFQNQLLVRNGRQMTLTPLGVSLTSKVKHVLQEIENTFSEDKPFDPSHSTRQFRIGMSDYAEFVLLPRLFEKIAQLAPGISIRVIHVNMLNDATPISDGKLDFGVGVITDLNAAVDSLVLFQEEPVCVTSKIHSPIKKLTLNHYLTQKHLAIVYQDEPSITATDNALKQSGLKRDIALAVPHMVSALHALSRTSLIGTVPKRIALHLQKTLNLTLHKPPFTIPKMDMSLAWHRRFANDKGHQWFRSLVQSVAKQI